MTNYSELRRSDTDTRTGSDWATALAFLCRFRHRLRQAAVIALCGAASSALQLLIPLSSALIINQALPNKDFGMLAWIAAGLAAATLLSLASAYSKFYLGALFRERISVELQRDLFEHIQRLPISFFQIS